MDTQILDYIPMKEKIREYFKKRSRSQKFLQRATKVSTKDILDKLGQFYEKPNPTHLMFLGRSIANSGTWLSHSAIRYLISLVNFKIEDGSERYDDAAIYILNKVSKKQEISYKKATYAEIFKTIYNELEFIHHSDVESPLKVPKINCTLVLISGVFNEIFSTAAFERGAKHLSTKHGLKYITPRVYGTKGSKYNKGLLQDQLNEYIKSHPNEKLWFISFSKGGVDSLHFLEENKKFAEKHIIGISTIASPILGSDHTEHKVLKGLNSIHKLSNNPVYRFFDRNFDFLMKDFQESLSSGYQRKWFKENHSKLPKKLFYTALAMEAEWYESHLWMMLTKLIFPSDSINDGIVDAENALFPDYFQGLNLGIVKGHHLVGTRSSYYSQEALLEAHIIFLDYLEMLPKDRP